MSEYGCGPIKVIAIDHHRNGVGGAGFYVILFTISAYPNETMLAVSFEIEDFHSADNELKKQHNGEIAILSVEKLVDRNIEFAKGNSYRYEFFEKAVKKAIADYWVEQHKQYELKKS